MSDPAVAPATTAPAVQPVATTNAQPKAPSAADAREAEYQTALKAARGDSADKGRDASGRFQKGAGDETDEVESGEQDETDVVSGEGEEGKTQETDGEADTGKEAKVKSYNVNGKEVKVDLSDDKKVDTLIQKGLAADENFQKAAKIQTQAQQFIEAIRDNPLAVLTNPRLGLDQKGLRDQVERWLYEQVSFESAPEDERQRITERRELERLREKDQREQTAKRAKERSDQKAAIQEKLTPMFIDAIEKANLPATDYTLHRMAMYMRAARTKGMTTITPADVAPLVARDWANVQRQMFSRYDGADLIKHVGEEAAAKIRKADLARVDSGKGAPGRDPQLRVAPRTQAPKMPSFSSPEEYRDYMMRGGK